MFGRSPVERSQTVELAGISVAIVRSARRRKLSLEVDQKGARIRVPDRMRERTIRQFVISKENWIRHHLANLPPLIAPITLQHGCELMLLGSALTLVLAQGRKPPHTTQSNQLILPIVQSQLPQQQTITNKLIKWYKTQALDHLKHIAAIRVQNMFSDRQVPKIKVRDYKRRWGSCNHRGELSFNWRIIMAPAQVIDYVVIHELAHLQEFNHSARFWKIVEQQMPAWRDHRNWLNDNGGLLYRL